MKVKDLKQRLNEFDDNLEIIMSIDPEGNGFNKMSSDLEVVMADLSSPYIGGIMLSELTENHIEMGCTEEDLGDPSTMSKCLVIWA